jgi:hypothetical protein
MVKMRKALRSRCDMRATSAMYEGLPRLECQCNEDGLCDWKRTSAICSRHHVLAKHRVALTSDDR